MLSTGVLKTPVNKGAGVKQQPAPYCNLPCCTVVARNEGGNKKCEQLSFSLARMCSFIKSEEVLGASDMLSEELWR